MNDDRPADETFDPADDDGRPVTVALRALLVAEVGESLADDQVWAMIEREAGARRTRRTRRRAFAVAAISVAAVLILVLVLRLDGADDESQVTVGPEPELPTPDPFEGTEPDSWVRLLGRVPASAADRPLEVIDLARAREVAQPMLPGAETVEAWQAQSQQMFGVDNILAGPLGSASPLEIELALGIRHDQFDQVAIVYPDDGLPRYVARGRFDPAAIAAAVAADPQWSPMLEIREHRGVTYYRWGEDLKLYRKSPGRELGNGGRLVVGDGWLAWSFTDADAEATIDAWLDPGASLAADDALRRTVEGSGERGLSLLSVVPEAVRGTERTVVPPPADLPPIDRPLVWSQGSIGPTVSVQEFAATYPTDADAAANLDAYAESWRRFATDAVVDVAQHGVSLVARVRLPAVDGASAPGQVSDGTTLRTAASFPAYFTVRS